MIFEEAMSRLSETFPDVPVWIFEEMLKCLKEGVLVDDTVWADAYYQHGLRISDEPPITIDNVPAVEPLTYRLSRVDSSGFPILSIRYGVDGRYFDFLS